MEGDQRRRSHFWCRSEKLVSCTKIKNTALSKIAKMDLHHIPVSSIERKKGVGFEMVPSGLKPIRQKYPNS